MKLEAVQIKVLKRRDNGSGVIEIPIITISGDAITIEEMQEMVANHEHFPIVPVGVSPHREFDDRAGFSPAFLENPSLRNGVLFAELDLIAPLFHEVVELGGWRSFSIEARKNLKTTTQQGAVTRALKGWVIVGGVFTNRPAVDAHFKIAAEGCSGSYGTNITSEVSMGAKLAAALNRAIDAKAGDGDRAAVVASTASAGGIDAGTLNQILNGSIDCPPLERLQGFARSLGVGVGTLTGAARGDGCEYGEREEAMADERKNRHAEGTVSADFHETKIKEERDKTAALETARVELNGRNEMVVDENKRLRLEAEEAKTTATDATNDKLAAEAKSNRLETENRGLKSANVALKLSLTEVETKHQEAVNKNLSADVREIIETAIKPTDGKQGVPPRVFEGWAADPAAYMVRTFTTLENFKTFVSALPGAGMEVKEVAKPTGSGHVPGTDPAAERDADEIKLTAEEEEVLDRLDLPSEYDGVMDEAAARKVHKALEAAKAKSKE